MIVNHMGELVEDNGLGQKVEDEGFEGPGLDRSHNGEGEEKLVLHFFAQDKVGLVWISW